MQKEIERKLVIVFDINGVLADVCNLKNLCVHQHPNLTLNNRQAVFFRPYINLLFSALSIAQKYCFIFFWTSRQEKNATPIVEYIIQHYQFSPDMLLTGENCDRKIGRRPAKNAGIIEKMTNIEQKNIIFFDDDVEKIFGHSLVFHVNKFNQSEYEKKLSLNIDPNEHTYIQCICNTIFKIIGIST